MIKKRREDDTVGGALLFAHANRKFPPPGASIDYQRLTRIFSHNIYCLYFKPIPSHCNSITYGFIDAASASIDWLRQSRPDAGWLDWLAGWPARRNWGINHGWHNICCGRSKQLSCHGWRKMGESNGLTLALHS